MAKKEEQEPIVLFGALRSGTTLFRLILDHHPSLSNPGETDFLLDHIQPSETHPTGWQYDIEALTTDRIFRATEITLPNNIDGTDLLNALLASLWDQAPDRRGLW